MSSILAQTISDYISCGEGVYCGIGDDFAIIDNPSFTILPNHPYRSPLAVCMLCHAGSGVGRINAKSYDISQDVMFIILPNQITELVNVDSDFRATYILMSEEFTTSLGIGNTFDLNNSIVRMPYIHLQDRARQAIEGYISMCRATISEQSNPHHLEIIRLLTRAFFLGFGYFMHEQEPEEPSRKQQLTQEFIRLVEANYKVHRDLRFYADRMGLTAKYISTIVKLSSGKSATEWIEKYVTLDAITQLHSTSRTVKEIAYDLGFPSQSCFGKYFCRVVGLSPSAYREKHR